MGGSEPPPIIFAGKMPSVFAVSIAFRAFKFPASISGGANALNAQLTLGRAFGNDGREHQGVFARG